MYIFSPLCPRVSVLAVANERIIYNVKVIIMFTELLFFCFFYSIFFPIFVPQGRTFLASDQCLQHAFTLHHNLCSNLLIAYQGLFGYFTSITKDLPSSHRMELGMQHCALISASTVLLLQAVKQCIIPKYKT